MFNPLKEDQNYKYFIDRVSLDSIEGWAYHRKHNKCCNIEIRTADGELLSKGIADLVRSDMANRACGFKLPVNSLKLLELTPRRFVLMLDSIKVADTYFFISFEGKMIENELLERNEILESIKVTRLEKENEYLTKRVADLEQLLKSKT